MAALRRSAVAALSHARPALRHVAAHARASSSSVASLDEAADATIAALRQHPALLRTVLQRADGDVRQAVLGCTAEEAFAEADTDGDGTVTPEEQAAYLGRRYHVLPAPASPSATAGGAEAPSGTKLRRLAVFTCVPFIGFGFLDNAIMILAGDQIDATFGAMLGLSSLAAAGLGNLVSDVVGIQAGDVIQRWATAAGLPEPGLTPGESKTGSARLVGVLASMVGISLGCVLGLSPLLVMEDEETRGLRRTFESIDVDSSGRISVKELESAVHAMGISLSRRGLETVCGRAPAIAAACGTALTALLLPECAQVFNEIDTNRDKQISFEEFKQLGQRWKEMEAKV
jgi:hypothetical protein